MSGERKHRSNAKWHDLVREIWEVVLWHEL